MTKYIGILLVISGIIALFTGAFIDFNYGAAAEITGRAVYDGEPAGAFGYLEAAIISYSIISLLMGLIFLFRV
ncbi:hypothetical protein HYX06_05425 [Candidatus Woesearchaeota archaeon]|nr:hypothetical protein [Candidatus Woesearchaeota archaeon]